MEDVNQKAKILVEALPYVRKFRGRIFVIKYSGSVLGDERIRKSVLQDLLFLHFAGIKVILIHGGGTQITRHLQEKQIEAKFHQGNRVTSREALNIVCQELMELNALLVNELNVGQIYAIGINGYQNILFAQKKNAAIDLGFVGEIMGVDYAVLERVFAQDYIPVLSPLARDRRQKRIYNVNADDVASFLSSTLRAEKLIFLTGVRGLFRDIHHSSSLISSTNRQEVLHLIQKDIIQQNMLPKIKYGLNALEKGVRKIHLIDVGIPHALLLEIFTNQGVGTEITS